MDRRIVLKLMAAGVLAPRMDLGQGLVSIAAAQTASKLHFFSAGQNDMIDRLSEIIIPADDHSPGAHQAKVSLFIDVMLSESSKAEQSQWLAGMEAVDAEAKKRFSKPFVECGRSQQDAIVAAMARNEAEPASELERFFVKLKRMTIDGYYTSEVGIHQDLQYKGNTALGSFPGCTHPEHQA